MTQLDFRSKVKMPIAKPADLYYNIVKYYYSLGLHKITEGNVFMKRKIAVILMTLLLTGCADTASDEAAETTSAAAQSSEETTSTQITEQTTDTSETTASEAASEVSAETETVSETTATEIPETAPTEEQTEAALETTTAATTVSETEAVTESLYRFPNVQIEKRDDLEKFQPYSEMILNVRKEMGDGPYGYIIPYIDEGEYPIAKFNWERDEITDLINEAYKIFYGTFEDRWCPQYDHLYYKKSNNDIVKYVVTNDKTGELEEKVLIKTGVSYESFYSYLSDVFTYEFISELETKGTSWSYNDEKGIHYFLFGNYNGELCAMYKGERGHNPVHMYLNVTKEEETPTKIRLRCDDICPEADTAEAEIIAYSTFYINAVKCTDGKWRLDNFCYYK